MCNQCCTCDRQLRPITTRDIKTLAEYAANAVVNRTATDTLIIEAYIRRALSIVDAKID